MPSLVNLSLKVLHDALYHNSKHGLHLVDLTGMAEHLVFALLLKFLENSTIDYRIACLFRDSGHEEIRELITKYLDFNEAQTVACHPRFF